MTDHEVSLGGISYDRLSARDRICRFLDLWRHTPRAHATKQLHQLAHHVIMVDIAHTS